MMKQSQITYWCHEIIRSQARTGGLYIDATMGNGNDTLMLCELAGEAGEVFAFDIQEMAVKNTRERLEKHGVLERAEVLLESHTNMGKYASEGTVNCITFNFGYLPGGDHSLATKKDTSIEAIHEGLRLLKKGGMLSLCIYSGGDTGFEEKDGILEELEDLDGKKYLVIESRYANRKNNPPMPVLVIKL